MPEPHRRIPRVVRLPLSDEVRDELQGMLDNIRRQLEQVMGRDALSTTYCNFVNESDPNQRTTLEDYNNHTQTQQALNGKWFSKAMHCEMVSYKIQMDILLATASLHQR